MLYSYMGWQQLAKLWYVDRTFDRWRCLCISRDNNGNFYAAGSFKHPGQNPDNHDTYLAKWFNNVQSVVPGSEVNDYIYTLTEGSIIYAAGGFTNNSGNKYVAKWDCSSWSELGSLKANNRILSICTDAVGNVYAAGEFTNSNNVPYVAIYKK